MQEKYKLLSFIGKGSYGQVVLARNKLTGEAVAIKMVKNFTKSEYATVKLLREI